MIVIHERSKYKKKYDKKKCKIYQKTDKYTLNIVFSIILLNDLTYFPILLYCLYVYIKKKNTSILCNFKLHFILQNVIQIQNTNDFLKDNIKCISKKSNWSISDNSL